MERVGAGGADLGEEGHHQRLDVVPPAVREVEHQPAKRGVHLLLRVGVQARPPLALAPVGIGEADDPARGDGQHAGRERGRRGGLGSDFRATPAEADRPQRGGEELLGRLRAEVGGEGEEVQDAGPERIPGPPPQGEHALGAMPDQLRQQAQAPRTQGPRQAQRQPLSRGVEVRDREVGVPKATTGHRDAPVPARPVERGHPRLPELSRLSVQAERPERDVGRRAGQAARHRPAPRGVELKDGRGQGARVREVVGQDRISEHMRMTTRFLFTLSCLNSLLIVGTAAVGVSLWLSGDVGTVAVATALPLAWQIANMAGWVSWEISGIFENVGVVQEGMESIAVAHTLVDRPSARPLAVTRGAIEFDAVRFAYGQPEPGRRRVLDELSLRVAPGERLGLVGRSGAGKTTLMNLLLRFYDVEGGRILIDGQDLRDVTQESLRAAIGVVTQDSSMLHRSIAANIRYGRPEASDEQVQAAARQAHAHDFIAALCDWKGRTGYDAHAGERGVKLSGGQRQRVALARVILKDAPILLLDEATSALDSEVEAAIQEQLDDLMVGKTVIAIAHRLSTIARMDRLVVMDEGRIVEAGTHDELLGLDGHYAMLWRRQSGGFLASEPVPARA